ncbi:PREDICTED: putative uncharacterized protein DDB_G0277255 [Habropoda laboriosa]|uniref:putative uncharacterized protein DDB_G0277255 n=1 Tax=Habropoda laboriosa TaxID=597456 RepID=UPI00083D1BC3|nr:PREDICTED: putative uncharacterized protein DDB_G0277255 [Habropoda laboriosa]
MVDTWKQMDRQGSYKRKQQLPMANNKAQKGEQQGDGLGGIRLYSPQEPTTIDTIRRKDSSSPVSTGGRGGEGGGRGGRGGGGLAHERTRSRRRQVAAASLLDDQRSTSLDLVEPYWLHARFSRPHRKEESSSTRFDGGIVEFTSTDHEDFIRETSSSNEHSSTITAATTATTTTVTTAVPVTWTTVPFRLVHRTVPRLPDDDDDDDEFSSGRRDRKSEDENQGVVGVSSRKNGGKLVFAGDGSGEVVGGGGGVVEWTTTVAGPMSSWSYPEDEEQPGAGSVRTRPSPEEVASEDEETESGEEQVKVTAAEAKGSSSSSSSSSTSTSTSTTRTTSTSPTTTQLPPPSQDTSMEAHSLRKDLGILSIKQQIGKFATAHKKSRPYTATQKTGKEQANRFAEVKKGTSYVRRKMRNKNQFVKPQLTSHASH